jgi:hypothetical protein
MKNFESIDMAQLDKVTGGDVQGGPVPGWPGVPKSGGVQVGGKGVTDTRVSTGVVPRVGQPVTSE